MKVLNTVISTKKVTITNHNLKGNFQMHPIYTKQIEKVSDYNYILSLTFSVFNTMDHPFPVDLTATITGQFTFDNETTEDQVENFMQIPAIQILYPHLRSVVASITAASYLQPLLLPLVDARVFKNV